MKLTYEYNDDYLDDSHFHLVKVQDNIWDVSS